MSRHNKCISSIFFLVEYTSNVYSLYHLTHILSLDSRLHISHILYYSLCQLTQLENLDIGWNPLNTVPEVVSLLTSLKELNMWSCKLSTLLERFVSYTGFPCIDLRSISGRPIHGKTSKIDLSRSELVGL